jgi:hypothetical protein
MSFFRSAALRRIIYAVAIALALVRLATRAHSEEFPGEVPAVSHAIVQEAE